MSLASLYLNQMPESEKKKKKILMKVVTIEYFPKNISCGNYMLFKTASKYEASGILTSIILRNINFHNTQTYTMAEVIFCVDGIVYDIHTGTNFICMFSPVVS